jgi:cytochrome P450/NADPH-cytochrome P450 reductase
MTEQPTHENLEPIPQPPGKFLVGNLPDIEGEVPILELMRLAREYGPIYQLTFPGGRQLVVVSDIKLVDELCDQTRFDKRVGGGLQSVRSFVGDGLFSAHTQEPNWRKAHNILLPYFSMRAMPDYHPKMAEIAGQLMGRWQHLNPGEEVDVSTDMTRLTLDTIGLCGFDYRFNSVFRETPHPFVQAMMGALEESMERVQRLPIQDRLMFQKRREFESNVDFMYELVDHLIKDRKEQGEHAADKKDLLGFMLTGVDKQTGEQLDETNIRYQCITFLVAGHETTSGLLSFAIYFLLKHPSVLAKAYEEVDRVLGTDPAVTPTFAQVHQLQYVNQILKESLRLWPTVPGFSLYSYADETVIGGRYLIRKEQGVMVLTPMLHREKRVWGEDAEEFKPERFSPEAEQALPANAYKPFGNGQRACIGRTFAMQEATLALGMILQRFQLIDHKHYELKIKQTLTIKPENFTIQVKKRELSPSGKTGQ